MKRFRVSKITSRGPVKVMEFVADSFSDFGSSYNFYTQEISWLGNLNEPTLIGSFGKPDNGYAVEVVV